MFRRSSLVLCCYSTCAGLHELVSLGADMLQIKPPTAVVQAAYPPRSPQPQSETSIMFFPALTTSPGSSVDLDSGSIHGGFTVSHYEESDGTPDTPTYLKTLSSGFPSTFALSKGVLWWYDTNAYNGESRIASGTLDQEAAATIAVSTVASLPLQPLLKAGNNKPSSAAKKLRKALRKAEKQEQQKLSVSEIVTSCHSISADDSLAAATCPHKETLPTNLAHFSVADNPLLLTTQDEGPDLAKALKAVSPTGHPAALPAVSPLARLRKNAESKNDANLERPAVTELPAPTGSTPAGAPEDESSCVLHCNPLFQAQEAMPMFTPIALTVDSSAEGPTTDDCGVEACKALRGKTTPLKPGRSGRTATMSPKHSRSLHRHVSLHVRTVSSASYTTFCGSEGRGPCSGASTGRACQVEQRTYTHVSSIGSNGGQPSSTGPASQDQGAIAPPMSADSETFGTPKGHCMPSVIQGTPLVWRTLSRRCSGGATAELHCKQQDNKTGKRKSSRSCRFRSASVPMAECEPRAAKSSVLEPRGTKKTTTRVHRDSKFAPPVLEEAAMPANAPLLPSRASLGGRVPEATSRSSVVSGTEKWIEDDDSLQIHGTKPGKHPRWTVTGFMQIVADRCVRTAQKFCKPFRSKRGDPEGKFSRLDGLP